MSEVRHKSAMVGFLIGLGFGWARLSSEERKLLVLDAKQARREARLESLMRVHRSLRTAIDWVEGRLDG